MNQLFSFIAFIVTGLVKPFTVMQKIEGVIFVAISVELFLLIVSGADVLQFPSPGTAFGEVILRRVGGFVFARKDEKSR